MRRTLRLAAIALLAGGLFPLASPLPAACASSGDHAALVIDLEAEGDVLSYCVALDDEEVSGIELIALAGEQFGLDYRLGYGGEAVCMLAGVGTESDDCFAEYPDFWGYWRSDGSGGWTWSGTGGGSTSVEPGDVEGWSWGSGSDGSSHPQPPDTRFDDVCEVEPEPAESPPTRPLKDKEEARARPEAEPTATPAERQDDRGAAIETPKLKGGTRRADEREKGSVRAARFGLAQVPSPAPTPVDIDNDVRTNDGFGELLTIIVVIAMVATGFVMDRRRRSQ